MGVGGGVDDDAVDGAHGLLYAIHDGALVVGLVALARREAGVLGHLVAERQQRRIVLVPVEVGLPHAQQVDVRPVDHKQARATGGGGACDSDVRVLLAHRAILRQVGVHGVVLERLVELVRVVVWVDGAVQIHEALQVKRAVCVRVRVLLVRGVHAQRRVGEKRMRPWLGRYRGRVVDGARELLDAGFARLGVRDVHVDAACGASSQGRQLHGGLQARDRLERVENLLHGARPKYDLETV